MEYKDNLIRNNRTKSNDQALNSNSALFAKKLPFSSFEKLLLILGGIIIAVLMVTLVSIKISFSSAQQNLQSNNGLLATLHNKNTNLNQEIGELQDNNKLNKLAHQHGLSLSNTKIRNVNK